VQSGVIVLGQCVWGYSARVVMGKQRGLGFRGLHPQSPRRDSIRVQPPGGGAGPCSECRPVQTSGRLINIQMKSCCGACVFPFE
jgi:hypothetical protein